MTFQVTYDEGIQYNKVFYSTSKTRKSKCLGEFYKKMDAVSKEIKRIYKQLEADRDEAEEVFVDAGNDALAERFSSGGYRFDSEKWSNQRRTNCLANMIISEEIEDKKNDMLLLIEEFFDDEVLVEEEGARAWKLHFSGGAIFVDDEDEQRPVNLDQYFDGEELEKWDGKNHDTLEKQDWYILWEKQEHAKYKTEGSGNHDGDFDESDIDMHEGLLTYRGLPLDVPTEEPNVWSDEVQLHFEDGKYESVSIKKKEKNKVPFGEGFIYPDEKKYCFMKRSAADVVVTNDSGTNFFTFTPCFGEFKDEFSDLDKYLVNYVKESKQGWCDVDIEWLRHCHYEINPETKELGEFLESSGIEGVYLEWNNKTEEFDEREDEDEEEEEEE